MDAFDPPAVDRRTLLTTGLAAAGTLALGPGFWREALAASPARPGAGPYGPLGPQDANGIRLPEGFRSRVIARAGLPVPGTGYVWHLFPDGQATYPTGDGGFILVSNSEMPDVLPGQGGASAIRFDRDGRSVAAYPILSGTSNNCAGGSTPWGTWMSCEETDRGLVWECDPTGRTSAVARPAMGAFDHEAVCVDPRGRRVYLSEDRSDSGFYRFTPTRYPDCSAGLLEIATLHADGAVTWTEVPDPAARTVQCRRQVPDTTPFRRGEGIWFDSGVVYLATTGDNTVWEYTVGTESMERLYHGAALGDAAPFQKVDNVAVSASGDLFVCEDPGEIGMGIITPEREAARFMSVTGVGQVAPEGPPEDVQNEITGVIFDPSGTRMFFSAQRSFGVGAIYEITGPFRQERVAPAAGPPLRLEAPARVPLAEALRHGPRVGVRVGRPAAITVRLRASVPGRRKGSRRTITVAKRRLERGAGPVVFRLSPTKVGREALRHRRAALRATLVVTAVDAAGRRTQVERAIVLSRRTR